MASIGKDKNGLKRVLFVSEDGRRKTIRLGKVSMKQALAFKVKTEALIAQRFTGNLDDETSRWLAALPDAIHTKLHSAGLVNARASMQLKAFLDQYIKARTDVKPSTKLVLGHTRRNLISFFGEKKLLRDITEGDADNWCLYLSEQELAKNTIRRRCGIAKQYFRAAQRNHLIPSNPFTELRSAVHGNEKRQFFVTRDIIEQILDACPDVQWRAIIGLTRFGGLRCPSEVLLLKWSDIDFNKGKVLVHSPKTEHHPGGETRQVPLFPELRLILLEAFDMAETGDQYVITRYRSQSCNLRTQLHRITKKAGLKPWPKSFQNLRSTRQTELEERWPSHVVCAWIGNSRAVARKHYLQVTEEHFEQAAQNPAQYDAVEGSIEQDVTSDEELQVGCVPDVTRCYGFLRKPEMGDTGLEPVTPCV